jgi:hypothetical protein
VISVLKKAWQNSSKTSVIDQNLQTFSSTKRRHQMVACNVLVIWQAPHLAVRPYDKSEAGIFGCHDVRFSFNRFSKMTQNDF